MTDNSAPKDKPRQRWLFWRWIRRITLGLLGLLAAIIIAVFLYAKIKDVQASRVEPPSSALFINVGGRSVYLRGMGLDNDGPAVILLSGFANGTTPDSGWWADIQPTLAETMRVYTFDYAGYAWSDPNSAGLSHNNAADDLHAALTVLGEEEVILVSTATASNTTIFYYNRYPDDPRLAGLLWIDPDVLTPEMLAYYCSSSDHVVRAWFFDVLSASNAMGFFRLYYELYLVPNWEDGWAMTRLTPRAEKLFDWDAFNRINARRGTYNAEQAFLDQLESYCSGGLQQAASMPLPTDIPLYVIQTDFLRLAGERDPKQGEINVWRRPIMEPWYREVAESSAGGRYIFVPGSDHLPMVDQPDVVIEAIQALVEQVNATVISQPAFSEGVGFSLHH